MHIDLSTLDPDLPLEHAETDGIRGMVDVFTRLDPTRRWTPREIAQFVGVADPVPPATLRDFADLVGGGIPAGRGHGVRTG